MQNVRARTSQTHRRGTISRCPAPRCLSGNVSAEKIYISSAALMACVGWYKNKYRHSGSQCVTPHQRDCAVVLELCSNHTRLYQQARQRHPREWTGATRCRRQLCWQSPSASSRSKSLSTNTIVGDSAIMGIDLVRS